MKKRSGGPPEPRDVERLLPLDAEADVEHPPVEPERVPAEIRGEMPLERESDDEAETYLEKD